MIIKLLFLPWTLFRNVLRLVGFVLSTLFFNFGQWLGRKQSLYAKVTLAPSLALGIKTKGWQKWFSEDAMTWLDLRRYLKVAANDKNIKGLIIEADAIGLGQARAGDLMDAIAEVRNQGKHVVFHTKEASLGKLRIMSVADDVLLTPAGRLYTFGMRMELPFYRAVFDRVGIHPQYIHLGEFKTATHQFHKQHATQAQMLMMRQLFDGLKGRMVEDIATNNKIDATNVIKAIEIAPVNTRDARQLGLIHGHCFKNQVDNWVEAKHRGPEEPIDVDVSDDTGEQETKKTKPSPKLTGTTNLDMYVETVPRFTPKPFFKKPHYMAVMDLTGAIVTGGNGPSLPGRGGNQINPDDVIPMLNRLKKDRTCRGLLLHINSPGGSALGSDLIWEAIMRLREKIPVVAYCSDVAASGGYYLAVGADVIVCRPESITGSIGVIVGKFSVPGVIEKLGITVDAIYDEDSSGFQSLYEPLNNDVMLQFRDDARVFYQRFLERVGQARNIERRRMHRFGRGRVYLGKDAKTRGLVDDLGGFESAVSKLYGLAQLREKDAPLSFVEHKKQSLRQAVTASMMSPQQRLWLNRAQSTLDTQSMMFEHDRILALMPGVPKLTMQQD